MDNLQEAPVNDTPEDPNDDPSAIASILKKELQCPVCDEIPNSLPISCCPSGHILCKVCKTKIVSGRFGDKPCPVCRSPLGNNTSYLAATIISSFTDIPCPNKILGCSFLGTLDGIKTHPCQFRMVLCSVCLREDCMRKDFYIHNNMDCFHKDDGNNFSFPTKSCFFLVQGDFAKDEVLVKARFKEIYYDEDDEPFIDIFRFTSFVIQSSNQNQVKPSKLKIVVENPDNSPFKMEVVTEIEAGPYKSMKLAASDLLLAPMEGKMIHFELIY